jgi:hypothetical protein
VLFGQRAPAIPCGYGDAVEPADNSAATIGITSTPVYDMPHSGKRMAIFE